LLASIVPFIMQGNAAIMHGDRPSWGMGDSTAVSTRGIATSHCMDIHRNAVGLTDEAAAAAHQRDLEVQHKHGVRYLSYWYDKELGKVFCLVEAPSKEAAAAVHREAYGNVADEIFEVKQCD
jgi:hypothetical protein